MINWWKTYIGTNGSLCFALIKFIFIYCIYNQPSTQEIDDSLIKIIRKQIKNL